MRGRLLLVGLVTMAVAMPLVAQADKAVISKPDVWYSRPADSVHFKSPVLARKPGRRRDARGPGSAGCCGTDCDGCAKRLRRGDSWVGDDPRRRNRAHRGP